MVAFRLEFGTAPSAEPGAPPVTTNDILAMVSPESESVPLLKVSYIQRTCLLFNHLTFSVKDKLTTTVHTLYNHSPLSCIVQVQKKDIIYMYMYLKKKIGVE